MGLEKVKERVLEEARQKAKKAIETANAEAREILKSSSKQIQQRESELMAQLQAEVDAINRREAATAKLESKKLELTLRKELVESVFSQAKETLSKLPEPERASYVRKLLKKANSELKAAVIYCNKKDAKSITGFKVVEADIAGGIIAESADGSLRVDYSYEALLEQLKDSLMPELDKLLFT